MQLRKEYLGRFEFKKTSPAWDAFTEENLWAQALTIRPGKSGFNTHEIENFTAITWPMIADPNRRFELIFGHNEMGTQEVVRISWEDKPPVDMKTFMDQLLKHIEDGYRKFGCSWHYLENYLPIYEISPSTHKIWFYWKQIPQRSFTSQESLIVVAYDLAHLLFTMGYEATWFERADYGYDTYYTRRKRHQKQVEREYHVRAIYNTSQLYPVWAYRDSSYWGQVHSNEVSLSRLGPGLAQDIWPIDQKTGYTDSPEDYMLGHKKAIENVLDYLTVDPRQEKIFYFLNVFVAKAIEKALVDSGATSANCKFKEIPLDGGRGRVEIILRVKGLLRWKVELSPLLRRIIGLGASDLEEGKFIVARENFAAGELPHKDWVLRLQSATYPRMPGENCPEFSILSPALNVPQTLKVPRISADNPLLGFKHYQPRGRYRLGESVVGKGQTLTFTIPNNKVDEAIDLKSLSFYLSGRILYEDGSYLSSVDPATPVNNFLGALIKNVRLKLGGRELDSANGLYSYKDYFLRRLTPRLQWENMAGGFQDAHHIDEQARRKWIAESAVFEFRSQLKTDLSESPSHFVPMTPIEVEVQFNPIDFMLMKGDATKSYRLDIHSTKLFYEITSLSSTAQSDLGTLRAQGPAIYPFTHREMAHVHIPIGVHSYASALPIFSKKGKKADRYFIGLVAKQAFTGSSQKDPFSIAPNLANSIRLLESGNQVGESNMVNFGSTHNHVMSAYYQFLSSMEDNASAPTFADYISHSTIYAIVRDRGCPREEEAPILEIVFDTATEEPLVAICMAEYTATLEVDAAGACTTDVVISPEPEGGACPVIVAAGEDAPCGI